MAAHTPKALRSMMAARMMLSNRPDALPASGATADGTVRRTPKTISQAAALASANTTDTASRLRNVLVEPASYMTSSAVIAVRNAADDAHREPSARHTPSSHLPVIRLV